MNAQDRLIQIREVAARLGLSVRAVYRLVASGDFPPPVKVGGATRFYLSDLEAYLAALRTARPTSITRADPRQPCA
ncbi:MAG TPA: helix-turn-helix domain-containing protein [Opitutaceae bacterium]